MFNDSEVHEFDVGKKTSDSSTPERLEQTKDISTDLSGKICDDENLKALLTSWNLIELYEKLIENGFTYRSLEHIEPGDLTRIIGNDIHLNGPMVIFRSLLNQWKTDSTSTTVRNTFSGEIDLESIICRSEKGKEIFKYSKKNILLPETIKRELVKVIVDDYMGRGLKIPRPEMRVIAREICNIFSKEKENIYYDQRHTEEPTGLLYVYHNNAWRSERKRKAQTTEKPLTLEEQLSNSLTDEVETSLNYLKTDDYENGSTTLKHWKICYNYRRIKMIVDDVDEIVHDWPHLQSPDGYILISADFAMKHGEESARCLISRWDQFVSDNLNGIRALINNPVVARELRSIVASNNRGAKNKSIIMALHHILIPSSTVVKKKRWAPTIIDSQNAFLTVVRRLSDMKDKIEERKSLCRKNGMKFHPMIFEIETGNNFIVVMNDIEYESSSLIDAIDIAFKIFEIFDIHFPHDCKNVWMFIDSCFYKIHAKEKLCHKGKILLETLKF